VGFGTQTSAQNAEGDRELTGNIVRPAWPLES
jgi:hypothetical protein